MNNLHMPLMHSQKQKCDVCLDPIGLVELAGQKNQEYIVCNDSFCKAVITKQLTMTVPLFKSYLAIQRKVIPERRRKEAAKRKRIFALKQKEEQDAKKALSYVLKRHQELKEDSTHVLNLPSGHKKLTRLKNHRIEKYTHHLESIIQEAAKHPDMSELIKDQHFEAREKLEKVETMLEQNPKLHAISNTACGMCKGGCCTSGEDHAYLSAVTIRRYMDSQTDWTEKDILNSFLSCLQANTVADSCINQTAKGCSLPRALRSDICNGFYCEPLKKYQKKWLNHTRGEESTTETVLAIQRAYDNWEKFQEGSNNDIVDVALISGNELELVDITLDDV